MPETNKKLFKNYQKELLLWEIIKYLNIDNVI